MQFKIQGILVMAFTYQSGIVSDICMAEWDVLHVSNGSGQSLRVWILVGKDPALQWQSCWSIHHNCHSGTVEWISPNLSELGGLSVGSPAGLSVDSSKALAFAL